MQGRSKQSNLGPSVIAALLVAASFGALPAIAATPTISVESDVAAVAPAAVRGDAVDPGRKISVDILLPYTNRADLDTYTSRVNDPSSPIYGRFLSPEQFAVLFGASIRDFDAVTAWAHAYDLKITEQSEDRTLISVTGDASQIEKAFGVEFYDYTANDGTRYFAADRAPSLPVDVADRIESVIGMSNYGRLRPQYRVLSPGMRAAAAALSSPPPPSFGYGHGHYGAYDARDLNIGYSMPGATFNGRGQTVAVYEDGGFFAKDIAEYEAFNHLPNVSVVDRNVNGYGGGVDDLGTATEAALDVDMEMAIAPAAKDILVYEDGDSFDTSLLNVLAAVADDDRTPTLSISYGLDEQIQGDAVIYAEAKLFKRLAVEGISVLAASGDNGVVGDSGYGKNVLDPGSQPLVTCVGGTTLFENLASDYIGEQTWNELTVGGGATGGGVSKVWPIPSYQLVGTASVATANGGSATRRNVPDVCAVADPFTGVDVYATEYGGWTPVGGTSASTPIWAGYLTLVEQTRHEVGLPRIGLANVGLYEVGTDSILASYDYHDVIGGDNGSRALFGEDGYFAGYGYDNVTGFGSMVGNQLLTDLASVPSSSVSPPAQPTGLAAGSGNGLARVHWNSDPGATGYYVYIVDPATGNIYPIAATKATEYTVTGLTNGRLYEFYLAAVNAGGANYAAAPAFVMPGS